MIKKVPFGDLKREYKEIKEDIDFAIKRVLESGWFILGKELEQFEEEFAKFIGSKYAVGVASGTDAIKLALLAGGIKQGDNVIVPAMTAVPTACAVTFAGGIPKFIDITPKNYCLDSTLLKNTINEKTKAIIFVHLYGNSGDIEETKKFAKENNLLLIEDCAQAHGTKVNDKIVGTFGDMSAFSFYPSKNLGAYGDAGMICTDNEDFFIKLKMLRNYGQEKRYYHSEKGINSRLDEIQSAILHTKLKYLTKWNLRRIEIAKKYEKLIENDLIKKPSINETIYNTYHIYPIRCKKRDKLQSYLKENNVETLIHYPIPVHLQKAYQDLNYKEGDFEESEKLANEELSLPIFPQLSDEEVEYICNLINYF